MKIIVTGASGFIGQEVLQQCIDNPTITSIIVLSRRSLSVTNPKLKVVILEDFLNYPNNVIAELEGSNACIWTLGDKSTNAETCRRVNTDFPIAGMDAISKATNNDSNFRFVYFSGMIAVRDKDASTWIMGDLRKLRGEIEGILVDRKDMQTYIMRPGMVVSKGTWLPEMVRNTIRAQTVNEVAAVTIDLALNGSKEQTWNPNEITRYGRSLSR